MPCSASAPPAPVQISETWASRQRRAGHAVRTNTRHGLAPWAAPLHVRKRRGKRDPYRPSRQFRRCYTPPSGRHDVGVGIDDLAYPAAGVPFVSLEYSALLVTFHSEWNGLLVAPPASRMGLIAPELQTGAAPTPAMSACLFHAAALRRAAVAVPHDVPRRSSGLNFTPFTCLPPGWWNRVRTCCSASTSKRSSDDRQESPVCGALLPSRCPHERLGERLARFPVEVRTARRSATSHSRYTPVPP